MRTYLIKLVPALLLCLNATGLLADNSAHRAPG